MIKYFFIIFLFLSTSLKSEVLKKIDINGNSRIDIETIKVYGNIELGKDYSNSDINQILKNLYDTSFFEDINLDFNNNVLSINLKEYPVINIVELNGEPSEAIKKVIFERIKLKNKGSFISNKLSEDINLIKKIYSSLGFNFAKVDAKVEKFSNNRVNLIFDISRGDKTFIKEISFIGDKKINDSKLRSIIVSEEKKFWKFLSKNTFYNQANIDLDKRLLLNYYTSLGYYDAQVISNEAEINLNNELNLTYTINAGKRYKINKISTNVADVLDKKIFFELNEIYKNLIGEYYSPFKVKKLLDQVDIVIANNDLQFVEHSVNEIIENENIEIKINIYEGKKDLVEKVFITGNTITDESVIRSELLLDEGDPLNELKLDLSIAKLKARNLFANVRANIEDGSQKNFKKINISVEEKPTGEISAGAGVGTSGGSLSFNVSENNWLGKGIKTSFFVDANAESFTGGFELLDPNYKFSGNEISYFLSNTKNDKTDSGFKNKIFTTGIGTKFEQYRSIFVSPRLSFSYDDLEVEDNASSALKKQKGTFSDLTADYTIISDKRDRAYGTTDGYIFNFGQSFPIYADTPFFKNSISINKYHSITENMIAAIKFYGAAITGLNNEDVRLSKRLNLNSSRLRGFEYGKIGPKDGNDYVGGNYAASSNFEINLPNLLPESSKIDVGLFLDVGNVWDVDYNKSLEDSNKIRSSVGLNTNWLSPLGPMSFVFSQNISKANTDVTESFNFRLGTTF